MFFLHRHNPCTCSHFEMHEVIVVGAGWSGLGVSAALSTHGVSDYLVLEKGGRVGSFWGDQGYERLQMHTAYHSMPHDNDLAVVKYPIFKTKEEVVQYLDEYSHLYNVASHIKFNSEVTKVSWEGEHWKIETKEGKVHHCKYLVIATGLCAHPYRPHIPNEEVYNGRMYHFWDIKNGKEMKGREY